MKDRIQVYMNFKNINAGELASRLEVQRSNISHILNGRNKPSASFIEKMLNVFPDLNARWLLTGEGTMTNNSFSEEIKPAQPIKLDLPEPKVTREQEPYQTNDSLHQNKRDIQKVNLLDDAIERIVLFYKDGSFNSFVNRKEK